MKILLISEQKTLPPSYFKIFEGDYIESRRDVIVKLSAQDADHSMKNIFIIPKEDVMWKVTSLTLNMTIAYSKTRSLK